MNLKLLDLLVCPLCKGGLKMNKQSNELVCRFDRLAYPVRDEVPILLETSARKMSLEEMD